MVNTESDGIPMPPGNWAQARNVKLFSTNASNHTYRDKDAAPVLPVPQERTRILQKHTEKCHCQNSSTKGGCRQRESQHPLWHAADEQPGCGELHLPRERVKQCQGLGRAKKVGWKPYQRTRGQTLTLNRHREHRGVGMAEAL